LAVSLKPDNHTALSESESDAPKPAFQFFRKPTAPHFSLFSSKSPSNFHATTKKPLPLSVPLHKFTTPVNSNAKRTKRGINPVKEKKKKKVKEIHSKDEG
jgi:hypothetical protein